MQKPQQGAPIQSAETKNASQEPNSKTESVIPSAPSIKQVPTSNDDNEIDKSKSLQVVATPSKPQEGQSEDQTKKKKVKKQTVQGTNRDGAPSQMQAQATEVQHVVVKPPRIVFNAFNTQYDVIKEVCRKVFGWRVVSQRDPWLPGSEWDIQWTDVAPPLQCFNKIKPYQRINHFPGMFQIARKNYLARNLKKMKRQFPKDYKFFPKTWLLPYELNELKNQIALYQKKNAKVNFIVKPECMSQGKGIFITRNVDSIDPNEHLVVQKYLRTPFLIDGFKFDLRIYVLVTNVQPLRVFIHKDGLGRFATEKYKLKAFNNPFIHLTNYAINKDNANFTADEAGEKGHKRSLQAIWRDIEEEALAQGYKFDIKLLHQQINDIIVKTLISIQPDLIHHYRTSQPGDIFNTMCFEILGFDIIIDSRRKPPYDQPIPYLLEVNHAPSFNSDTQLDRQVKKDLLSDTFRLLNISIDEKNKLLEVLRQVNEQRIIGLGGGIKGDGTKGAKQLPSIQRQDIYLEKLRELDAYQLKNLGGYTPIYPPMKEGSQGKLEIDEQRLQYYKMFLDHAKKFMMDFKVSNNITPIDVHGANQKQQITPQQDAKAKQISVQKAIKKPPLENAPTLQKQALATAVFNNQIQSVPIQSYPPVFPNNVNLQGGRFHNSNINVSINSNVPQYLQSNAYGSNSKGQQHHLLMVEGKIHNSFIQQQNQSMALHSNTAPSNMGGGGGDEQSILEATSSLQQDNPQECMCQISNTTQYNFNSNRSPNATHHSTHSQGEQQPLLPSPTAVSRAGAQQPFGFIEKRNSLMIVSNIEESKHSKLTSLLMPVALSSSKSPLHNHHNQISLDGKPSEEIQQSLFPQYLIDKNYIHNTMVVAPSSTKKQYLQPQQYSNMPNAAIHNKKQPLTLREQQLAIEKTDENTENQEHTKDPNSYEKQASFRIRHKSPYSLIMGGEGNQPVQPKSSISQQSVENSAISHVPPPTNESTAFERSLSHHSSQTLQQHMQQQVLQHGGTHIYSRQPSYYQNQLEISGQSHAALQGRGVVLQKNSHSSSTSILPQLNANQIQPPQDPPNSSHNREGNQKLALILQGGSNNPKMLGQQQHQSSFDPKSMQSSVISSFNSGLPQPTYNAVNMINGQNQIMNDASNRMRIASNELKNRNKIIKNSVINQQQLPIQQHLGLGNMPSNQTSTRSYLVNSSAGGSGIISNNGLAAMNMIPTPSQNYHNRTDFETLPNVNSYQQQYQVQQRQHYGKGSGVYVLESTFSQNQLNSPIVITSGIAGAQRFPRNSNFHNSEAINANQNLAESIGSNQQHQQILGGAQSHHPQSLQQKYFSPPINTNHIYQGSGKPRAIAAAAYHKVNVDPASLMLNDIQMHNQQQYILKQQQNRQKSQLQIQGSNQGYQGGSSQQISLQARKVGAGQSGNTNNVGEQNGNITFQQIQIGNNSSDQQQLNASPSFPKSSSKSLILNQRLQQQQKHLPYSQQQSALHPSLLGQNNQIISQQQQSFDMLTQTPPPKQTLPLTQFILVDQISLPQTIPGASMGNLQIENNATLNKSTPFAQYVNMAQGQQSLLSQSIQQQKEHHNHNHR